MPKRGNHERETWRRLLVWLAAPALALQCAAGCGGEQERSEQARALLLQLQQLHDEPSLSLRKQALDALSRARLADPSQARARDLCRTAHARLLDAEAEQAAAKQALAAALREAGPGTTIAPERSADIEAKITRSNQALEQAKTSFPACERAMADLARQAR